MLRERPGNYIVMYGDVIQPGIAALLELTYPNSLVADIGCSSFDISTLTCVASEIHVEVEGTVSNLTSSVFTITFGTSVSVNFSNAGVKGVLADEAEAEVVLYGFDDTDYLAHIVAAED